MIFLYILAGIVWFYLTVFVGVTLGSYAIMVWEYKTRGNKNTDKFKFTWFGSLQIAMIAGGLWPVLVKEYIKQTFLKKAK